MLLRVDAQQGWAAHHGDVAARRGSGAAKIVGCDLHRQTGRTVLQLRHGLQTRREAPGRWRNMARPEDSAGRKGFLIDVVAGAVLFHPRVDFPDTMRVRDLHRDRCSRSKSRQ